MTNLPREVGPHQVAGIYRVRWEIESDNKLDKSCNHLDSVQAQTGAAVRSLVHASLISSMLACLICHRHRIKERKPRGGNEQREVAPIHPQSLARAMGSSSMTIATAFEREGADAAKEWNRIAELLHHLGRDSNWRRSSSTLDQMRGWRIAPGRPKRLRLASPMRRAAK